MDTLPNINFSEADGHLVEQHTTMQAAELIRLIFDEEDGTVFLYDLNSGDELGVNLNDLGDIPSGHGLCLDKDDEVFAVVVDNPDQATFSVAGGSERLYVAVLKEPVQMDDVDEAICIDIPLSEIKGETDGYFHFDDLYPASEGGADSATEPKVERINDARVLGEENAAMDALLAKPAKFLLGELWDAKDKRNSKKVKRNTQDGDWSVIQRSWKEWIEGGPKRPSGPPWGFSRHTMDKHKGGTCVVLGSNVDGARKKDAMVEMYALGLDIDSGAGLDQVVDKILEKGIFALVYTTHSHGKTGMEIKRDDVIKKLGLTNDPTLPQVQEFLRDHSKDRFEDSFISQVRIEDGRKQTSTGVKISLTTPPLDKFRVIFPFDEPVKLIDLAKTQQAAREVWEDKITGMAVEELGVNFDTACTDPSRTFYLPRHAENAEWESLIIRGAPLKFEDIKSYKKHQYTKHRAKLNPFELAGGDDGTEIKQFYTPSGRSLNDWHSGVGGAKDRFQFADLLEDHCPDKIRHAGGESEGHVHIECPFEHEHSSEGGTACMAVNAIDSQSEFWSIWCHHDSCQGRHKLEFLEEMLRQEWFDEELLFDDDGMYLLDPGEVVVANGLIERAKALTPEAKTDDLTNILKEALQKGVDGMEMQNLEDALVESTGLGKRKLLELTKAVRGAINREREQKLATKRNGMKMPDLVPLEAATIETVNQAAANIKWTGKIEFKDYNDHRGAWFGEKDNDGVFHPLTRAFEIVHFADGGKIDKRSNQITIRYPHRAKSLGIVESVYSLGDTYKDSNNISAQMANEGLEIAPDIDLKKVMTLFRSVRGRDATLVDKAGWNEERTAWIAPTGEVVTRDATSYVLVQKMRVSAQKAGSLDLWKKFADTALRGRNGKHFLPGFLCTPVGILNHFLDEEFSVIIANEGHSTRGKSTALKASVSWIAIPNTDGLVASADVTPTAMEALAARANGAVLVLDEEGVVEKDAGDKQSSFLCMAEGKGRGRGTPDAGLREITTWNVCFGVSTEAGFVQTMEKAQATNPEFKIRTGAVARIFSINYDDAVVLNRELDADELAAYDGLKGTKDGFGDAAFGWAAKVFAHKLLELGVEAVHGKVDAFIDEWGRGREGAEMRVVRTVCLVAVAAQIAKEAELIGDDIDTDGILSEHLEKTLLQRAHHLDTDTQVMDRLRTSILRAVNTGEIVDANGGEKLNGRTTIGYFRSSPSSKSYEHGSERELSERVYILPVDRLKNLNVDTDIKALITQIGDGVIPPSPKGKHAKQKLHETVPTEGRQKNLRLSGAWVHGLMDSDDVGEDDLPPNGTIH